MPNVNLPMGIKPINDNGTPWSGQGRLVAFPAAQATNIFIGDPLVPLGGTDAFGVPLVGIASAGATFPILGGLIGIANGPAGSRATVTRDMPTYRQASLLNYGFVCDDPNQIYIVQEDGATAAASGGWKNANLVAGAGNLSTGFSGWQLSSASVATAAPTLQLRMLGLVRGPDNEIGTNAKWAVRINLPALWAVAGI